MIQKLEIHCHLPRIINKEVCTALRICIMHKTCSMPKVKLIKTEDTSPRPEKKKQSEFTRRIPAVPEAVACAFTQEETGIPEEILF